MKTVYMKLFHLQDSTSLFQKQSLRTKIRTVRCFPGVDVPPLLKILLNSISTQQVFVLLIYKGNLSMATSIAEGTLLWEPSEELKQQSTLLRYMQWLEREKGLQLHSQGALWE